MEFCKKYFTRKSLGISLCILCWTAFAIQFIYGLNLNKTYNIKAININKNTKEIIAPQVLKDQAQALNIITGLLKNHDKNIRLVFANNAGNYYDYYFYSPLLEKYYNITPLSQGFNIHIAVTNPPVHIYIGIPYIDYDF